MLRKSSVSRSLLLMASLSSALRFFPPKLSLPSINRRPPSLLTFSSPISFQPLSTPSPSPPRPIRAQSHTPPETQSPAAAAAALPENLQRIVALFQSVPEPKARYLQLLHYGTQLPPYPPRFRTDDHRVRGCVSQVWVRAYPDPNDPSKVRFDADSDSVLTKGLAALLVLGLSGETPSAVAAVPPEFVHDLGLRQSLTPSRNNGFLNMLRLMQAKAAEIGGLEKDEQDELLTAEIDELGGENGGSVGVFESEENEESNLDSSAQDEILTAEIDELDGENGGSVGTFESEENEESNLDLSAQDGILDEESKVLEESLGVDDGLSGGRKERMRERLEKELNPVELEIEDVSHMHAGHAGVRGNTGGETHFNLKVVSKEFEGKSMVKRHRLVYDLLREELESGLHALSIVAKSPSEV